ncbi:MAG: DUF3052 domain-containing protein [Bowdeniella nasicola]|nr:DUF3052 domain-containing protein [Bowdeniella nasicola]
MLTAPSSADLGPNASDKTREAAHRAATEFGFTSGQIVQEFYYDDDVDMTLRTALEEITGEELEDEDYTNTTDGAIVWWRAEDAEEDDLADLLVDASANLDDGGDIWVLTPKAGRAGHVAAADVEAAAGIAGMHASASLAAGRDWMAMRLVVKARSM